MFIVIVMLNIFFLHTVDGGIHIQSFWLHSAIKEKEEEEASKHKEEEGEVLKRRSVYSNSAVYTACLKSNIIATVTEEYR